MKNKRYSIDIMNDYAELRHYDSKGVYVGTSKISIIDIPRIETISWAIQRNRVVGYDPVSSKKVHIHRYLLNPTDDLVVDHINCDTLDNRRENLRMVPRSINSMNRSTKNSTPGIVFHSSVNKWLARVFHKGKLFKSKYCDSKQEALLQRKLMVEDLTNRILKEVKENA